MTRLGLIAGVLLATSAMAGIANAETFRWSATTDPSTMDPHAANLAPVTSFLNNIYEGLVRRGKDMALEPSLATSWEPLEDEDGWRFHLREGVTFHDGSTFNADDVLFSYERGISEQSDVRSWFAPVSEVRVVDDLTVEIVLNAPNPIFPDSIANWMIMDRDWAQANGSIAPARDQQTAATLETNGTGPFMLVDREPGVQTTLVPNPDWWDTPEHNITQAIFNPITTAATAIAALVSNEVDMLASVPVQDVERLRASEDITIFEGIEARVIMLGFGHDKAMLYGGDGSAQGNPFQDVLVRQAVAHAVNVEAIDQILMNGLAKPASQLQPAGLSGYSQEHSDRPEYDLERAAQLLIEAGHPDGFSFNFKCTNDRYLNDSEVCQAIVAMLAQIGLEAQLEAIPVANYWTELREGNYDMYLLGWSPGTFDAEHPIRFLAHTPTDTLGTWNYGGYSNARIDELLPMVQSELDPELRQSMLDEIAGILQEEVAYVPLYEEPLVWAARDGISVVQRPDNFFMLRWVTVDR